MNALTKDGEDTLLRLVIIWRRDTSHIKYEWVTGAALHIKRRENETAEHSFNTTKAKLDNTIQRLLRTTEALSYEAEVKVSDAMKGFFFVAKNVSFMHSPFRIYWTSTLKA